jgi:hypothetical protein
VKVKKETKKYRWRWETPAKNEKKGERESDGGRETG